MPGSTGRRGFRSEGATQASREEAPQRVWNFLQGIFTKTLRITGSTPTAGQALVATNTDGDVGFSSTLPATSFQTTAQTASQTGTLVATASGEYLLAVYLECTTAGAAGTLDATFSYTDDVGAVTTATLASVVLTGTGRDDGIAVARCSAGGIDYTFTVTGAVGGPVYSAYVSAIKIR